MHIRKALVDDFTAMLELGRKFYSLTPYQQFVVLDEVSLIRTFKQLADDHVLLVAEADDKIIGMAGAFIAPLYWNSVWRQGLEVFWWIEPLYRSNGAGTALRRALEAAAKSKGADFWHMVALKDSMSEQVSALYERDGHKPMETVFLKVL